MKSLFRKKKEISNTIVVNNFNIDGVKVFTDVLSSPIQLSNDEFDFIGGIIDLKTLTLLEEAILIRHGKISQKTPALSAEKLNTDSLPVIDTPSLYAGLLFDNFGHFLLESLSRLWAYSKVATKECFILFYAPWGIPDIHNKNNYIHQCLKALGIPLNKIIFLEKPVIIKHLIVPEQKYGFGKCKTPDQQFVDFIKTFQLPSSISPRNFPEKIYISRSKLPYQQGKPIGEIFFEQFLKENGYQIIYPEKLTLYHQLELYKHASSIIFCDGGAIYCNVLLPEFEAEIAIIARRRDYRWNYKEITDHFVGYKKDVLWIDEVTGQYEFGLETWDAMAEIDWFAVSVQLTNAGFIEKYFEEYKQLNLPQIKKESLKNFIQAINTNPLFLKYMEKLKQQYPLLPTSFDTMKAPT